MLSLPALRKSVWLLPIVLVVCALMVLPAGSAFTPAHAARAPSLMGAASSGLMANALPNSGANLGLRSNPYSPTDVMNTLTQGASPSSLGAATNSQLYAQALNQIASKSGFGSAGLLQGLATQVAAGKVSPASVYLPNLALLNAGPQSPGQTVGVGYYSNPAPMGIGDFGLGNHGPYAYNSSHFAGSLTLNAANATYPGAYYFITPPGNSNGSYNTPYEFGIQLNTVTSNISIPGNSQAAFWTQNVLTLNGNILQFEDNVWNFSDTNGALLPGSLYSYNGTPVYNTFYYDYGPVFKLTFPVTIDLYNNASLVNHRDQVTFGYRIVDSAGTFAGVYDTVVFNNPNYPTDPANTPVFEVNGKTATPLGLDWDSELIFGGPGGGSNAVFNNISGTESLSYSNATSGGWKTVPSAYDFGGDTGETAIGVAETWNPGGTVGLSAGPSLLYGLWNSQPSTAVPSGSIEFQGTITPTYGFVFVGDYTTFFINISYVPTNAAGGFLTYLPPVSTNNPNYDYYGLADGYARAGPTSFTAATTGLPLTLTAAPGTFTSPLYLNGDAQAQAAATLFSGWTTGQPYIFAGLLLLDGGTTSIDPLFYDHLNDWGFVSFNLFQATGIAGTLNVTRVNQGNSNLPAVGQNSYLMDGPLPGTPPALLPAVQTDSFNLPSYGGLIAFYSDSHVQAWNQLLTGYIAGSTISGHLSGHSPYYNVNPAGGAMVLWNSPNANVTHTASSYGSYGVYVAGSPGFSYWNGLSVIGANTVSLAGSSNAVVNSVFGLDTVHWVNNEGASTQEDFGVYDLNSVGGTFSQIYGENGGYGFADFGGTGARVNNVESIGFSSNVSNFRAVGSYLDGATHTSINNTDAYAGSIGVVGAFTLGTTVTNTSAISGVGFVFELSDYTNVTKFWAFDTVIGSELLGAGNTTITNTFIDLVDYGLEGTGNNYTTFQNLYIYDALDIGILLEYSVNTKFLNTNLDLDSVGISLAFDLDSTITNLNSNATTVTGVEVLGSYSTVVTNLLVDTGLGLVAEGGTISLTGATVDMGANPGIVFADVSGSVSGLTVTGVSGEADVNGGLDVLGSHDVTITQVAVNDRSTGVFVDPSPGVTVSGVTVTDYSLGVEFYDTWNDSVTGTTVSDHSLGVGILYSHDIQVTQTVVSYESIGVGVIASGVVSVTGVTASNATLDNPWTLQSFWFAPASAVATEDSYQVSISNVVATSYGIGLIDGSSGHGAYGPGSLTVQNLNVTGGYFAMVLNGTEYGQFNDIGAYNDYQGVWANNAYYNLITGSNFVGDSSYGIALWSGGYNYVWGSNFIGDNGATSVYSAAHIQAYSGYAVYPNYFYSPYSDSGNYWADWHTYTYNGVLAPYYVGDQNWDYYPLSIHAGEVAVWFYESGLAPGTSWSVTFNGVTQSTLNDWMVFGAGVGTYAYTVGAVAGYMPSPASGSVSTTTGPASVDLSYAAQYNVTLTETGLPAGTSWSAIFGGMTGTSTTSAITFSVSAGTYAYQIPVIPGYTASPSSGSVTVSGPYNISVAFTTAKYAVTVTESGLSSGTTWSATVNGVKQSTAGTSLTFWEANGTYTYSIANVSGYTLTGGSGSVTVAGTPVGVAGGFAPSSTPSLVSTDTYNTGFAVAIALAVIALLIGLIALFWRRRKQEPPSNPPAAWTPPAGTTGEAGGAGGSGGSGGSSGSSGWSEGSGPQ